MQRWLTILLGALAVALALVVAYKSGGSHAAAVHEDVKDAAVLVAAAHDAGDDAEAGLPDLADLASAGLEARPGGSGPGWRMPDGHVPPPLPPDAPKQVRIGVVLVVFAGNQGAPPGARPKSEALALAQKLAQDAKSDFHAAVVRGDSGSADDVGHIPRGVLEAATEYVAFTLAVGTTSDPLETPRGYWIIKRLD
jgi:PPIC-type PPIASE domain